MQSIQSYIHSGASTKQMKLCCRGGVISSTAAHTIFNFTNSLHSKPKSKAQAKLVAAKKHSETEKRRRTRINAEYVTLRTILPNLIKMDKASVLGETIRRVKELKKEAAKVEAACHRGGREDDECVVPNGADRLSLEYCELGGGLVMKAMLSCEDRVGLITEVTRAVRSVKGKIVRADMVTVGGRTKILMWVKGLGCCGKNEELVVLRRALKVIMERPVCGNVNRKLRFLQKDYF